MEKFNSRSQLKNTPWQQLLLCLGILVLSSFTSSAQDCDLACNGTLEFPVQLVINPNCQVAISTNTLVPDLASCPGAKRLTVRDSLNTLIADDIDLVQFPVNGLLNQRLSVTITDQNTGTVCVSIVVVVDNFPPSISDCTEMTVSCLANTSPEVLGFPTISDNCTSLMDLNLDFTENFSFRDCLSDTAGVIFRDWVVEDENGLQANCTQRINILRAGLMDVSFPVDVTLPCDDPSADPERTGMPLLNGLPLTHGGLCGLEMGFADDTTYICNTYMYQIQRTWTVVENCTDFFAEEPQLILISDDEGPIINCPSTDQLVFTSDPTVCSATVALPPITAADNCGTSFTFAVSSSYGATDFNAVSGVMPGIHSVEYQVTDECGNINTCTTQLTVVDDLAPIAACDDQLLVSIPTGGYAFLSADAFDEGSSDNCNQVFFRARRTITGQCDLANGDDSQQAGYQEWFDERVAFCCDDIVNGPITVTLRVYELDPGDGPVDAVRETGNGDLVGRYTDCQSIVSLQDATPPLFEYCPPALTIFCSDEQEDLSVYGSPVVSDNCGSVTLDSTAVNAIIGCGEGTITRSWTATDAYNQSSSCSQLITIENNEMLQLEDITWPEDVTFYECGASTDIEDLPSASQEPVINWNGCDNIGINQSESTFTTVDGACFKVLRTWTVIDWCHYDTENIEGPGRYVHTQIVKVLDNTIPEINCPESVTVNVGSDCATAIVNLGLPIADDCSTQITYTNNSPYANSDGADASGVYPLGETTVQFIAFDGCSNNNACTTTITVVDTEVPSLACILGLTVTLMSNGNGGAVATMDASALVASAADNCTATPLIKFAISRPGDGTEGVPTAEFITFDCFDADSAAEVTVWATDLANNTSTCTTEVSVQDTNDFCMEQTGSGMIAGGVLTEDGEEVENVMIMVSGNDPEMMYTDLDGGFMFDALSLGDDYSIIAQNNEELINGVTTYDLVLMSKHVLGTRILDSPYKLIAADIDRSGHISTLDIIKLRKLILNITTELPNDNTSWRFVDAAYVFPDPTNPFLSYFPEIYNVNNLSGPEMHADFVAVKVGDVNGSATPNSLSGEGDARSNDYPLVIQLENQDVAKGDMIDITFTADYMNEWMGYQFTLEFDPTALEVLEIVSEDLPNLFPEENFHQYDSNTGLITTVWNEFNEQAQQAKTKLFTLSCRAQQAGQLADWIYLSSRVTKAEAYTQEGEAQHISLSFAEETITTSTAFELFQNRPNPWTNSTIIPFQLDESGDAKLSVYDMAGKLVYQVYETYSEGYHEISISRDDLPATGLFYYTMEAGEMRATRKMVLN